MAEKIIDEVNSGDRSKRFITYENADLVWCKLANGYRDRVKEKLLSRAVQAARVGDWFTVAEEVRCWFIFRREWKKAVARGKRRIYQNLWKQTRQASYGRVWSRRDSGKPAKRGRPKYADMNAPRKAEVARQRAKKAKGPWKKRGRKRLPDHLLSRPRKGKGKKRGRPKKHKGGFRSGNHLLRGEPGGYRYVY